MKTPRGFALLRVAPLGLAVPSSVLALADEVFE